MVLIANYKSKLGEAIWSFWTEIFLYQIAVDFKVMKQNYCTKSYEEQTSKISINRLLQYVWRAIKNDSAVKWVDRLQWFSRAYWWKFQKRFLKIPIEYIKNMNSKTAENSKIIQQKVQGKLVIISDEIRQYILTANSRTR